MEGKKCSNKEDKDIDAISFCGECKIYMCNKCERFHKNLFSNHKTYNLRKQDREIFTGFCKEQNHSNKLEYFCKNHNTLCCIECISKKVKNGIGVHKDCDICLLEDIKEEKKNKVQNDIKYLTEFSKSIQNTIDELKNILEKIDQNKEELKINIQKKFTEIRNALNKREDELFLEVDKKYNNIFGNSANTIDKYKKLPYKIKLSLEIGKKLEFKDDELVSDINECINIENNIRDINQIKENFEKYKNNTEKMHFDCDEQINLIFESINNLGIINKKFDTLIINQTDKKELIINWIKEKVQKNFIRLEKIFIMSINSSSYSDFHEYCDKKGPTLTIVKTKKNNIFGGFTPLEWESMNDTPKFDVEGETFIFSLDLKKKYDIIDKEKAAIYCDKKGPIFGGSDFNVRANMKICDTYANQYTNFLSNNNLELIGEKGNNKSIDIEDFEVFKVIY